MLKVLSAAGRDWLLVRLGSSQCIAEIAATHYVKVSLLCRKEPIRLNLVVRAHATTDSGFALLPQRGRGEQSVKSILSLDRRRAYSWPSRS